MANETLWLVEIELKRIQTYLFEVPRLGVMVGANAILGETLRGRWHPEKNQESPFAAIPWSLPFLAKEQHACWPKGVEVEYKGADRGADVLFTNGNEGAWQDDVKEVALRTGILGRDGGRFTAVFPGEEQAINFTEAAQTLLSKRMPGVSLAIHLIRLRCEGGVYYRDQEEGQAERRDSRSTTAVLDVPQAVICEYSGGDVASQIEEEGAGERKTLVRISESVDSRRKAGKRFDAGQTSDILGILRGPLLEGMGRNRSERFPADFEELATQGYLAVIHADGNGVGQRLHKHMGGEVETGGRRRGENFFLAWARREGFFHRMRSGFRRAVVEAVAESFGRISRGKRHVPLRLLMLGGDDLLLVCGAAYAIDFVLKLAERLAEATAGLTTASGSKGPLTVGVGMTVVQNGFPFYRAHELAEELARSAKRLVASQRCGDGNVVDWIVSAEGWHGDVAETRKRQALVDGRLALSAKPYRILTGLGAADPADKSLQEMWDDAQALNKSDDGPARSQLLRLRDSLAEGRLTAESVARSLPASVREPLRKRHYLTDKESPWETAGQCWLTRIADLIELVELCRLRRLEEDHVG